MWVVLQLLLLGSLLGSTSGDAASVTKLIQDEFWDWRMREAPEFATEAGVNDYNSYLDVYNSSRYEENKNFISGLVARLNGLKSLPSFGTMSQTDKINYEVLLNMLSSYVNGYQWHLYTVGNPVNFLEGPQQDIDTRYDMFPFKSLSDFLQFFIRMARLPDQIDDMMVLMRGAISRNQLNHNVSMEGAVVVLDKLISQGLESTWFTKLEEKVNKSSLSGEMKDWLLQSSGAKSLITDRIVPAYQRLKDFIVNEYMPHTRTEFGVSSFPNGAEFYQAVLQWHLSVDLTANQVHEKGLQEVARIAKKMQQIMDRQNFTGTIQEYFATLSANPMFHVKTKEEGLRKFNDIIFNRITPLLKKVFKDIPPNPVVIEPLSYDGPAGMYFDGSADGSRPGVFKVNLLYPENIKTYTMASLSLHETVPGHHLQHTYAATATLPPYRQNVDTNHYYRAPFHFPFFTAYVEGWGLYAEFLGEEMGVYQDDYERMGKYAWEMFRACRLVVDTGIHAKGWSKAQAIDYMLKYTSDARHEVEVEVNRYITWPGQACAYKIGELKIRELRDKATKRLGGLFDVRDFHSQILKAGPLPLRLLEKVVDDWIRKVEVLAILNPIG